MSGPLGSLVVVGSGTSEVTVVAEVGLVVDVDVLTVVAVVPGTVVSLVAGLDGSTAVVGLSPVVVVPADPLPSVSLSPTTRSAQPASVAATNKHPKKP